jgi:modulator of FtsH protease
VSVGYNPSAWSSLFEGVIAAAASLTGLLFVAVSINLSAILQSKVLPRRALETLSLLMGLVFLSVFMLVPAPSPTTLGIQLTCLGTAIGVPLLVARLRTAREPDDPLIWTAGPAAVILGASLPMVIAGVTLIAGGGGGLFWLVPEVLSALLGAVINAWVLLVEIHR